MPSVLLLTGTCGVGKSTTAREWSLRRAGAHIRGDDIRMWIRSKELRRENGHQHELIARIASNAAAEYLGMGLDVAIDSVWFPSTLRYLSKRLSPLASVRMVWLCCEPAENRRRDAQREPGSIMGERVHTLQAELDAMHDWPNELRRIDSTSMNLDDVLKALDGLF